MRKRSTSDGLLLTRKVELERGWRVQEKETRIKRAVLSLCANQRGIKLISRTKKLWEKVGEAKLRRGVMMSEQQMASC